MHHHSDVSAHSLVVCIGEGHPKNGIQAGGRLVLTRPPPAHRYMLQRFGSRAAQASPSDKAFLETYLKDQGLSLGLDALLSVYEEEDKNESPDPWRSVTSLESLPGGWIGSSSSSSSSSSSIPKRSKAVVYADSLLCLGRRAS